MCIYYLAVRGLIAYAAGRGRAGRSAHAIRAVWERMGSDTRQLICKTVADAIARDDRSRARGRRRHPLGTDCDREVWVELREWMAQQEAPPVPFYPRDGAPTLDDGTVLVPLGDGGEPGRAAWNTRHPGRPEPCTLVERQVGGWDILTDRGVRGCDVDCLWIEHDVALRAPRGGVDRRRGRMSLTGGPDE